MIRLIKVDNVVYENVSPVTFDIVNTEEGASTFIEKPLFDHSKLKDYVKDTVLWLKSRKVEERLRQAGFMSLGDVIAMKDSDPEAEGIYSWYVQFSQQIKDFIENNLPTKTNDELLSLDLVELVNGMV